RRVRVSFVAISSPTLAEGRLDSVPCGDAPAVRAGVGVDRHHRCRRRRLPHASYARPERCNHDALHGEPRAHAGCAERGRHAGDDRTDDLRAWLDADDSSPVELYLAAQAPADGRLRSVREPERLPGGYP